MHYLDSIDIQWGNIIMFNNILNKYIDLYISFSKHYCLSGEQRNVWVTTKPNMLIISVLNPNEQTSETNNENTMVMLNKLFLANTHVSLNLSVHSLSHTHVHAHGHTHTHTNTHIENC